MKKMFIEMIISGTVLLLILFITGCTSDDGVTKTVTRNLFVSDIETTKSYIYTKEDNKEGINPTILLSDGELKFTLKDIKSYNILKDSLHKEVKCKLKVLYKNNKAKYKIIEIEGEAI